MSATRGRRSNQRRQNAKAPDSANASPDESLIKQQQKGQARIPFAPLKIISDDQVEAIHHASLELLRDVGINFQCKQAVDILRKNGAIIDADGVRVRFDPAMVMEKIALAPSEVTLYGRDPANNITLGGNHIAFGSVASTPNVSNLQKGRVTGNFEDFSNLVKLVQSLNSIDFITGYPVEPCDVPVPIRHLVALSTMAKLCTKPVSGYVIGRQRAQDAIDIARLMRGVDEATLQQQPSAHAIVNANSPLVYDDNLLQGAILFAEHNQLVVYTPFTLSGAMAPITLAGALVQQNAEALAGITLSQSVRAGAPVIYGSFSSNVDMKSGSPAFGTPEYSRTTIASGQLARFYNLPFRASNANASNAPDVQATYESQMSLWACMLGHVNYVLHGAGWIEGGLCTSYEKMIIDAEMIQMLKEFMQPIATSKDDLAVDAIAEVGPASHFFQSPHTMARYKDAFYQPLLSDWQNFENWSDGGAQDATMRANQIWQNILAEYQEPKMDEAIEAELDEFVTKRIAEGGVAAY